MTEQDTTDPKELAVDLCGVADSAAPALTDDELATIRRATAYLRTIGADSRQ